MKKTTHRLSSPQPLPAKPTITAALAATGALALVATAALLTTPAHGAKPAAKHANSSSATVSRPAEIDRCTGCHAANLQGRKGFAPGLGRSGVLKEYNQKSFERVMNTGVTPDGSLVHKPMPVFHYSKSVSDPMYKYLAASVK